MKNPVLPLVYRAIAQIDDTADRLDTITDSLESSLICIQGSGGMSPRLKKAFTALDLLYQQLDALKAQARQAQDNLEIAEEIARQS